MRQHNAQQHAPSPSDAKRLRELEAENNRLKKLLAEAVLDNEALKVAFGVKR